MARKVKISQENCNQLSSCNPALYLQTTAFVLLYGIFFIQLSCIFGGIWGHNMKISGAKFAITEFQWDSFPLIHQSIPAMLIPQHRFLLSLEPFLVCSILLSNTQ